MVAYGLESLLQMQATTGPDGFALQNGTPVILSWTAPNDGQMHRYLIVADRDTTSAETGGAVSIMHTPPAGAVITNVIAAGGSGVGTANLGTNSGTVAPGSTVELQQTSALTAGACTVFAELWAA